MPVYQDDNCSISKTALKSAHAKLIKTHKSAQEKKALSKARKDEKARHAINLKTKKVTKGKESAPEEKSKESAPEEKSKESAPEEKSKVSAPKDKSKQREPITYASGPLIKKPSRQEQSAAARKLRATLNVKAKSKGLKSYRKKPGSNKLSTATKAKLREGLKKCAKLQPSVAREGRIKNAILIKMGLREPSKNRKNPPRRTTAVKKQPEKNNPNAKKVLKKIARKKEAAERIAAHKEKLFKGDPSRFDKDLLDKHKHNRYSKKMALAAKKKKPVAKKEKKPFQFRKADGTPKKRADKATRLARIAYREKLRRKHPKVRSSYPTVDVIIAEKKPIKHPKCCKLRENLKPGTVCIVLAGVNKGKRVIFLKQLASGLCLVNGPLKLNRVPLRRIAQSFLLATSTRIHLPTLPIKHMDDDYFARKKLSMIKKKDGALDEKKKEKYMVSKQRKNDQRKVDFYTMKFINARKDKKTLKAYLATKFLLGNHDFPHAMKF